MSVEAFPRDRASDLHMLQPTIRQQRVHLLLQQVLHDIEEPLRPSNLVHFDILRRGRRVGRRQRENVFEEHLFGDVSEERL